MWNTFKAFCAVFLKDKIKELGKELVIEIKKCIWNKIKKDIIEGAKKALSIIETYLKSDEGKVKKETIADIVMSKVKLPVILKPFKNVIKKKFIEKIDETVVELLTSGNALLNKET